MAWGITAVVATFVLVVEWSLPHQDVLAFGVTVLARSAALVGVCFTSLASTRLEPPHGLRTNTTPWRSA